jgi:PAS domain S-box-containing protein
MITTGVSARILVVEDDAIVATDIEQSLEAMGYEVLAVLPDGDDAVSTARDLEPDIVLMDVRLPGRLDGIEAGTAVHEAMDIPVVYLTAYSDPATLERAKAAGSWGYLVKPFDNSGLRGAIEVAIHRHRAQALLKESEERYWTTLEVIPSAVIVTGADGVITQANPAAEYLFARPRAEMEGQPTSKVLTLVNRRGHTLPDPVETALREGGMVYLTGQNSIRLPGGRIHPVRGSVAVMRGGRDRVVGAVLVLDDVLVDSTNGDDAPDTPYRHLFRGDTWAAFALDAKGVIVECNEAMAGLLGIGSVEGVAGRTFGDFLENAGDFASLSALARATGGVLPHERVLRGSGGGVLHVILSMSIDPDDSGLIFGWAVDVSERTRVAAQVREALTIEVTGRLATGFAHVVEQEPDNVPTVVDRLLAAGQRAPASPRVISLGELLARLHSPLEGIAGSRMTVRVEISEEDLVRVDPALLSEALFAVVTNAREAMSPEVRIWTRAHDDGHVILAVRDYGHGMASNVLDMACEPFFTTKPSGPGLGLPFAQGIVRQAGGWLVVSSSDGAGCTVEFHLPAVRGD